MTEPMSAAEIAAKLTKAQRQYIRFEATPHNQTERTKMMAELHGHGLTYEAKGFPYLTRLGLAVRAELERANDPR